jgi:hypothetical protein
MISEDRVEKALAYMVQTDEGFATARSHMIGLEKQEKTILGIQILKSKQSGQQAKEAEARISEEYAQWRMDYEHSVFNFELIRNKRNSEAMVIECWRSLNANRRKGNIT